METPMGLSYTPMFPALFNVYKTAEQKKALADKAAADAQKTALDRANESIKNAYKYKDDKRPFIGPLETYYQEQMNSLFAAVDQVRKGNMDPTELDEMVAKAQADSDEGIRKNGEYVARTAQWEKTGIYDMEYIRSKYANATIDLESTHALGTTVRLKPQDFDINGFINQNTVDPRAYNGQAVADKFINRLVEKDTVSTWGTGINEVSPGVGQAVSFKEKSIAPRYIASQLGSAGQKTINFGTGVGSNESKAILNSYINMGPEYVTYLKLLATQDAELAKEDNPNAKSFKDMEEGSVEWGEQLQKSLHKFMNTKGHVPSELTMGEPPSSKTDEDKSKLAAEKKANDAADVIARLINQDESALGYLKGGPNIETAKYDGKGNVVIRMKQGKIDQMAALLGSLPSFQGMNIGKQAEQGVFTVPLSRMSVVELVNFKNYASSTNDWIGEHVEQAFNRRYPKSNDAPAATAAPAQTGSGNMTGIPSGPINPYEDPNDLPSDEDLAEFLRELPKGTKYLDKNGKVQTVK